MRLQEVLRERESEISALESSLKEREQLMPSPTEFQVTEMEHSTHLSPTTIQKFNAVRTSMRLHHGLLPQVDSDAPDNDVDESLDKLNELMLYVHGFYHILLSDLSSIVRSMAQKESQHKDVVDSLNGQLAQVQRAHDELITLSRDQVGTRF